MPSLGITRGWPIGAVIGVVALTGGFAVFRGRANGRSLVGAVASSADSPALPFRLSIPTRLAKDVASPRAESLATVTTRISEVLRAGPTPDALHAAALIDLLSGDGLGNVGRRSISYLEMVARIDPSATSALVDLSAAQLLRARGIDRTDALLRSLEASSTAIHRGDRSPAALFNRALALDLLGLDAIATLAWQNYRRIDDSSAFGGAARERMAALAHYATSIPRAPDSAEPAALAAHAAAAISEGHALLWDRLLPSWGRAVDSAQDQAASRALDRIKAIADTLAYAGRDPSAAEALHAIRALQKSPVALRRLARAHAAFGDAQERARANNYRAADSILTHLIADRPASLPLLHRALAGHANALLFLNQPDAAVAFARRLARSIPDDADPIPAARARWVAATPGLRAIRMDSGGPPMRAAAAIFRRIGDTEDAAGALAFEGETMMQAGELMGGLARVHEALLALRAYPSSLWRHNILLVLSRAAARAGLAESARAIEDEDLLVVSGGTRAVSVIEARLARARWLWAEGDTAGAGALLRDASRHMAGVGDASLRMRLRQEIGLTRATSDRTLSAVERGQLLNSSINYFARSRLPTKLLPGLMARASAAIDAGDLRSAERDLDSATKIYSVRRDSIARVGARAAIVAQARAVYDQLASVRLHSGSPTSALAAIEESRSFIRRSPVAKTGLRLPHTNRLVVEWALIGDSLVSWLISDGRATATTRRVRRDDLRRTIERARAALGVRLVSDVARADLNQLYSLLIAPLRLPPGDSQPLVIIPDRELGGIPFAALWNGRERRFFIEERDLVIAPSIDIIRDSDGSKAQAPGTAVFIGGREGLVAAGEEIASSARLYPAAIVRDGTAMSARGLLDTLASAELLHFAGHAVADDAEPERSYLSLGGASLTAGEIARRSWPRLRLAILSACETANTGMESGKGLFGLADAFLAAGAESVVGTLWKVEDEETRLLTLRFHEAYRGGADGAAALRRAQVDAIRGGGISPATWAAFRFIGR